MKALTYFQRYRQSLILCTLLIFVLANADAQVNLGTDNLNAALKEVLRVQRSLIEASTDMQPELMFQLGIESDILAIRLTRHMAEYGNTEKGLIDQILKRINDLNIKIQWVPDKQRYFYDGAAYQRYLQVEPEGPRAAESAYRLLEIGFFQSSGDDLNSLQALVKLKQAYLARFPDSKSEARTRIMLAIEFRDISRIYRSDGNNEEAQRFIDQARNEGRQVIEANPGTQEASTARSLLEGMEDEVLTPTDAEIE